ncbi:MAG: peptidoglycan-binding domain-containing protein [bacterium]
MKKYIFAVLLVSLLACGPKFASASGLGITPSSGPVNSLVTLNWPDMPVSPQTIIVGVENDNGGHGGQIRQFSLPVTTSSNALSFCFPKTLRVLSEAGTSEATVIPGTYHVSIATDTTKSGIALFTVTEGSANCTSSAVTTVPSQVNSENPDNKPVIGQMTSVSASVEDARSMLTVLRTLAAMPNFPQDRIQKQMSDIKAHLKELGVSDTDETPVTAPSPVVVQTPTPTPNPVPAPVTSNVVNPVSNVVHTDSPHSEIRRVAYGDSGVAVSTVQKILIQKGFLKTDVTGYFGAKTKKALMDFQTANGLTAVGSIGPKTLQALSSQ